MQSEEKKLMIIEKQSQKSSKDNRKLHPSLTDDQEELELIAMARDLSYQRLKNGTASAQEIVYWLKAGSSENRVAKEIQQEQKKLIKAKTKAIADSENTAKLYSDAIEAMKRYHGEKDGDSDEQDLDIF